MIGTPGPWSLRLYWGGQRHGTSPHCTHCKVPGEGARLGRPHHSGPDLPAPLGGPGKGQSVAFGAHSETCLLLPGSPGLHALTIEPASPSIHLQADPSG